MISLFVDDIKHQVELPKVNVVVSRRDRAVEQCPNDESASSVQPTTEQGGAYWIWPVRARTILSALSFLALSAVLTCFSFVFKNECIAKVKAYVDRPLEPQVQLDKIGRRHRCRRCRHPEFTPKATATTRTSRNSVECPEPREENHPGNGEARSLSFLQEHVQPKMGRMHTPGYVVC